MNLSKSSLTPAQSLDYLGMTLQTSPLRAFPIQARIQKVLFLVEEFSSSWRQSLTHWRSLFGVMSSMSTLITGSRLRMRSLQLRLNVAGPQTLEDALVSWDDSCLLDLRWWSVPDQLEVSLPRSSSPKSSPLHGHVGLWLGCFARRRPSIRFMVLSCFELFN